MPMWPNPPIPSGTFPVSNLTPFTVDATGAGNRAKIQAALNFVGTIGGGTVVLPGYGFTVDGDPAAPANSLLLDVKSLTRLTGAGWATNIIFGANLSANYIRGISNQSGAWGIELDHFRVDGNKLNNTNKMTAVHLWADLAFQPGPFVDSPAIHVTPPGYMASGTMMRIHDIFVLNAVNTAIDLGQYNAESTMNNCVSYRSGTGVAGDGAGMKIWSDQTGSDLFVGYANSGAFQVDGSATLTNCKVYGFGIFGAAQDGGAYIINSSTGGMPSLSMCEAEEPLASLGAINGFVVYANSTIMRACKVHAINGAGVYLTGAAASCDIEVTVKSATFLEGPLIQTYGLYCDSTGSGNQINVTTDGLSSVADVGGTTIQNQKVIGGYKRTFTAPAVTSGVAFIPSPQQDAMVYFQLSGAAAGTYTITYGPATGAEVTIANAVSLLATMTAVVGVLVPANNKVVLTLVNVTNPGNGGGANTARVATV